MCLRHRVLNSRLVVLPGSSTSSSHNELFKFVNTGNIALVRRLW